MTRSLRATAVMCWAALSIPLVLPLVTGRVFADGDFISMHLPLRRLYSDVIAAGDAMLWTPSLFSGAYIFAEGQAGFGHPFHWVLYRLLPLQVAFNLELITIFPFAGAGMYLLLRRWIAPEGAIVGAMLFAFSGSQLMHLSHINAIAVIAHVPWVLLAIDVLLSTSSARTRAAAFAGLVLAVASEILLGFPQFVWMTGLAVGAFLVWRLLGGVTAWRLAAVGAALMLAITVGAVQLLPSTDLAARSVRAAPTMEFLLSYSVPPVSLAQFWAPYAFRAVDVEIAVYDGVFCTAALAWLAVRWRSYRRHDVWLVLFAFAAVNLLLALGRWGGLARLQTTLPGIGLLRAPARHLVLVHAVFAVLGAIVFDDLVGMVRRGERLPLTQLWPLAVPLCLSIVTAAVASAMVDAVSFETFSPRGPMFSGLGRSVMGVALMGAAVLLFVLAARGRWWALHALLVLIALDLGLWGYRYSYRPVPPQTIDAVASMIPVPEQARPGKRLSAGETDLPLLDGVQLSSGYLGLEARTSIDRDNPIGRRLPRVVWHRNGRQWTRVPDPMPRARLVASAHNSRRIEEDLSAIDISRVALVQSALPTLSGAAGVARVLTDRPGHIVVRTTAPATQLLVLTEKYHDGWRATEDGRDVAVLPVYGDYLGGVVGGGTHDIDFTFAPASFRNGLRVTIAGLALTAIGAWVLAAWPSPRSSRVGLHAQ